MWSLMNKIEAEAWRHGADWQLSEGVGRGTWGKKVKGLAEEHTCMTPRHRQWCGNGQRKGAAEDKEGGKEGEKRDSYNKQ